MRWKLIVVLQSIFIVHYFDLNPIWPSLLERIQEPGGGLIYLGVEFQFFLEGPVWKLFTIFKRIHEVWMPRIL